jgi:5-(carboxyamino)imidazole ribonucleotide synthase
MPKGVPVGTLAIGEAGAANAGIMAARSWRSAIERSRRASMHTAQRKPKRWPKARYEPAPAGQHDRHSRRRPTRPHACDRRRATRLRRLHLHRRTRQPRRARLGEDHRRQLSRHAALADFARRVDVVTTEFENVPAETAEALIAAGARVAPTPARARHRAGSLRREKLFPQRRHRDAALQSDQLASRSRAAIAEIGAPAILKTRRLGYDGRGQIRIKTAADAPARTRSSARQASLKASARSSAKSRSSPRAVGWRDRLFDLNENEHAGGILSRTTLARERQRSNVIAAQAAAQRVLEAFDYVGVLTIEFFVMPDGSLVANEMAPRVHNSGHWTIEGALTSQFEQHIRAVAGWPLGPTTRIAAIEMLNLIGEDAERLARARRRSRRAPPSLRQTQHPRRPQNGPRHQAQVDLASPHLAAAPLRLLVAQRRFFRSW